MHQHIRMTDPYANNPLASAESGGWKVIVWASFFIPVQIIAVVLRFYSRWLVVGRKYTVDDYLILICLIFQLTECVVAIFSVPNAGVGHHLLYLKLHDPSKLLIWGKYLTTLVLLCGASVNLPKLAVLILYKRLFEHIRTMRIIIFTIAGILITMSLANVITALAACVPFEANWNPKIPGAKCIDKEQFFSYVVIPNMITDVALLVLPLPVVWTLNNTKRVKVGLTATFIIGSAGLVTSILRFIAFLSTDSFKDGTWDAVELIIWTVTEVGIYLICACLLTMRPLLERIYRSKAISTMMGTDLKSKSANRYHSDHSVDPERSRAMPLRKMDKSGSGFTQLSDEESLTNTRTTDKREPVEGRGAREIRVTTDIHSTWGS